MISAERLQDAIGLLPEDMLAPVDALRRQKRISWKPFAAVAASFLLVVGLWQLQPMYKSAENGKGMDAAEHAPAYRSDGYTGNSSYSEHSSDNLYPYCLNAKITQIAEDHLVVTLAEGSTAKVFLENVEEAEEFFIGAEIVLWFDTAPNEFAQLYPKDITIK